VALSYGLALFTGEYLASAATYATTGTGIITARKWIAKHVRE
jgi:hypothetical protein